MTEGEPARPERSGRLYRRSVLCGAVPLASGITVFVLWFFTGADWLPPTGFFVLLGGLLAFCVGSVSLLLYILRSRKEAPHRPLLRKGIIAGAILVANFPATFGIISLVSESLRWNSVTVRNDHSSSVEAFTLTFRRNYSATPEARMEWGAIPPGESKMQSFRCGSDSTVTFAAKLNGESIDGEISGYIGGGVGWHYQVIFLKDGTAAPGYLSSKLTPYQLFINRRDLEGIPAAGALEKIRGEEGDALRAGFMYWASPRPLLCEDWELVVRGTVRKTWKEKHHSMDYTFVHGILDIEQVLKDSHLSKSVKREWGQGKKALNAWGFDGLKPGDKVIVFVGEYDGGSAIHPVLGSNCLVGIKVQDEKDPAIAAVKAIAAAKDRKSVLKNAWHLETWRKYDPVGVEALLNGKHWLEVVEGREGQVKQKSGSTE